MKIGIIGVGVIGETLFNGFKKLCFEVVGYDKYKKEYKDNFEKVLECSVIFICLPTIAKDTGQMDMTPFDNIMPKLKDYKGLIVIKSTIIPNTTKKLYDKYKFNIVHCPEFLTMSTRDYDFHNPEYILIGKPVPEMDVNILTKIFFLFNRPIYYIDSNTTEFFKFMRNLFFATKISFANEMKEIAKVYKADYDSVKQILYTDKRVAPDQLSINKERRYEGMCLPKDINQLIIDLKEKGYIPLQLSITKEINERKIKLKRDLK